MRLPMHLKTISIALAVLVVSFVVSLKVMDFVAPRATNRPPALAELPPLPPAPRASTVMAPIAVTLSAIRDAADRGAPRSFTGKADNPISQILQNADIGWTASRGPISSDRRAGRADAGDAADGHTERNRLAVGEGDGCGRRRARRPARRQCRETNRQREHQEPQRQRRDQGQRRHHGAAEDRRELAHRAQPRSAGQSRRHRASAWPARASTCPRR